MPGQVWPNLWQTSQPPLSRTAPSSATFWRLSVVSSDTMTTPWIAPQQRYVQMASYIFSLATNSKFTFWEIFLLMTSLFQNYLTISFQNFPKSSPGWLYLGCVQGEAEEVGELWRSQHSDGLYQWGAGGLPLSLACLLSSSPSQRPQLCHLGKSSQVGVSLPVLPPPQCNVCHSRYYTPMMEPLTDWFVSPSMRTPWAPLRNLYASEASQRFLFWSSVPGRGWSIG